MTDKKRESFLENQINLYADLIDDLESSKMNRKEKKDLIKIQDLYKEYISEYKKLISSSISL